MRQFWRRWLAGGMALLLLVVLMPGKVYAGEVSITSDKIARGKTGKNMSVSFSVKNQSGSDLEGLKIAFDVSGAEIWDEDEESIRYGYSFPFEVTGSLHDTDNPRGIGKIASGKEKTVSLSGYVRRDLTEGYYKVPVVVMGSDGAWLAGEDLTVWITKSSSASSDDDDEVNTYDFVLGEGQSTPNGVYPQVMNFSLNLRNNSPATVYKVKASLALDADSQKFPFEINDANYDRSFEKIEENQTVSLDYSFAIREDAYTGYYPIGLKLYYSKHSSGDELEVFETAFFVRIQNKDKKDDYEEFHEHDRTKARLIVDSFSTTPEKIVAGDSFELILRVKNASGSVPASDILLAMESEKASDSPVFTTESGSSSAAISSLGAGSVQEVHFFLNSRPGVDQRSYALTFKAKFDSPEFKNAEESMTIDIPIYQLPRLNTGGFEVMPDAVVVGEESNVMFGINNTGRVTLYNVMVHFEADSIQTCDTYVGNIKSGETGNVDCMLLGTAPTADDGTVCAIISYEDENGAVSQIEKELTLFVSEPFIEDYEEPQETEPQEQGFWKNSHPFLLGGALSMSGVLAAATAVLCVRERNRKKKELDEAVKEDMSE